MSPYKLVAIDMDGTLLNDNKEISCRNKEKIYQLIKEGIHVVLATGRTFGSASRYAAELGLDIPIITYNGSLVKEVITEKVIYSKQILNNVAREVLTIGEKLKVCSRVYVDDIPFIEEDAEELKLLYQEHGISYRVVGKLSENIDGDPYMIIFGDYTGEIKEAVECLRHLPVSVTSSTAGSIEIMAGGVSKAKALEYLAGMLKIDRSEIIAIGNSLNDYEMISWAGLGVAMKNSDEELLQKWNIVSQYDNNEDGVAHILERYCPQQHP